MKSNEQILAVEPPVSPPTEFTSFIARELARVCAALVKQEVDSPQWSRLHLVQQSLSWALDPTMYAAPFTACNARHIDEEPDA